MPQRGTGSEVRAGKGTVSKVRVTVNPDLCAGYGTCLSVAPELFVLDEWGYASAINIAAIPVGSEEEARSAVLECPMNAIALEE
jgi:ferredoxin